MYTRNNPPIKQYPVDYTKSTFPIFDFGRDEKGELIVVKVDDVNYDELANAAAEGCDIVRIRQLLKGQPITNSMLSRQDETLHYGTVDSSMDMMDAISVVDSQVSKAKELYQKLPDELRNGLSLPQFSEILQNNPTYLETFIAIKAAQAQTSVSAPVTTDTSEVKNND